MPRFSIVRLGKDSVEDIREIDAIHQSPATPIEISVRCKQVPPELATGDYVFVCLGSDNSQGAETEWVRGLRAFGTVNTKSGGPRYNDTWTVVLKIQVVLPQTITKADFLATAPVEYNGCGGLPVVGLAANSQQTVQMIKTDEPNQNIDAFFTAISKIHQTFKTDVIRIFPELLGRFGFRPSPPATPGNGARPAAGGAGKDLAGLAKSFADDATAAGLQIEPPFAKRIFASLVSKRFLILTGLSGSGKSKVAVALANWIGSDGSQHEVVPVGADWTSNENIAGYPDGLDPTKYVTKPALELILRAADPKNSEKPYFLILDEMNLSHVERYFADVLSLIELEGKALALYSGTPRTSDGAEIPDAIKLPENLFIVGTVNVDETTYVFSPKVLDRANVIEFRVDSPAMNSYLANGGRVDLEALAGKGTISAGPFLTATKSGANLQKPVKDRFAQEMERLFNVFQKHDWEFGFRTAYVAARYVDAFQKIGGHDPVNEDWFNDAFDSLVVQKLLPKINGSRSRLEGLMWALIWTCALPKSTAGYDEGLREASNAEQEKYGPESVAKMLAETGGVAIYPLSYAKLARMHTRLVRDQFVSFAEA